MLSYLILYFMGVFGLSEVKILLLKIMVLFIIYLNEYNDTQFGPYSISISVFNDRLTYYIALQGLSIFM